MSVQEIGTIAIGLAMLIAFLQKGTDEERDRPTPKFTKLAAIILLVVGVVDLYLWVLELGTFTNHIKGFMPPSLGFILMCVIFGWYWWRRGTVEALDVMFGILMGHFWWSWC